MRRVEVTRFGKVVAAVDGQEAAYAAMRLLSVGKNPWDALVGLRYREVGSEVNIVPCVHAVLPRKAAA